MEMRKKKKKKKKKLTSVEKSLISPALKGTRFLYALGGFSVETISKFGDLLFVSQDEVYQLPNRYDE